MKNHFATKLVAVAVASMFAGSLAFAEHGDWNRHDRDHHDPLGAAAAAVVNTQTTDPHHMDRDTTSTLDASVNGNSLQNASGDIGVNVATGANNAQANQTAIAKTAANEVFGIALVDSSQSTSGNSVSGNEEVKTSLDASMGGNALNGASGNIGVNIASGGGNAQSNALAVDDNSTKSAILGAAVTMSDQSSSGNSESGMYTNTATVGGDALGGAKGNIGVNVTAGAGNVQGNALAITKTDSTLAAAVATSMQTAADNFESGVFTNTATLGGNALKGASGKIGVNIASGAGNLQQNGLAMVVHP
jgi:hypothetical protein